METVQLFLKCCALVFLSSSIVLPVAISKNKLYKSKHTGKWTKKLKVRAIKPSSQKNELENRIVEEYKKAAAAKKEKDVVNFIAAVRSTKDNPEQLNELLANSFMTQQDHDTTSRILLHGLEIASSTGPCEVNLAYIQRIVIPKLVPLSEHPIVGTVVVDLLNAFVDYKEH